MERKLVLIDGHSILNRAFYGVPDLTNAAGLHTNAVYGFLNILFKLLEEEKPEYLAVAFDVKAPTFRHLIYADYKGTRKPMPEELRQQVPVMKEVLSAMGICILEKAGYEADDILGTLAKKAEKEGIGVSLVSGDRDLLQIATDHIKIRIPKTKGMRTEIEDYYAQDVLEKYQVTPLQFIDLKALMGDSADNIPGVPKIGEKTATSLMVEYGSLEQIYAHVDEITKNSIRESLKENKELADLSKTLATIKTDCDVHLDYSKAEARDFFTNEAYELFKKLEFKNMLHRFSEETVEVNKTLCKDMQTVTELTEAEAVWEKAASRERIGFFVLEDPVKSLFLGTALAFSAEKVVFLKAEGFLTEAYQAQKLYELSKSTSLATFDIKNSYRWLSQASTETYFDVLIAAYLLNPLKNDYAPEDIANEYLNVTIPGKKEVFGKGSIEELYGKEPEKACLYAGRIAAVCYEGEPVLREKLKKTGMEALMQQIEMPLSLVLFDMEKQGIRVKPEELKAYGEALTGRIGQLEQDIYEKAGETFNINSPKQLGEILFEKMKLPGSKKTKNGYSTAAEILEKLAPDYPVVSDILEYRGLAKLKSTYADGLAAYIGKDSRIHSTFHQTITATGRISSTEPNLQNIPMRMELGRRIRKVFIPKEGCVFLDADYSQIELRVLAHMSGDEKLIEAYRSDADIHRITASQVFHTPFDQVTDAQRRNAKAVNFGIVYGISSFGLSQDLSISRKEAAEYIEQYFKTYPKVKQFLDQLVEDAKKNGYVTTLFGRRRPVPELASSNFMQRSFGERVAMNSPIQGTAADIIKIAMIRVYRRLQEEKLTSRLILQVHDELLIEAAQEEADRVAVILEEEMKAAAKLAVTLEVDLHSGTDWYEAK